MHYVVGWNQKGKTGHMTVLAEDALIAALKAKAQQPESAITYVRRQNKRGDARRPASASAME